MQTCDFSSVQLASRISAVTRARTYNSDCLPTDDLAMASLTATAASRLPTRCCRCNGTAKCLRCVCAHSGAFCSSCLAWVMPGTAATAFSNHHHHHVAIPPQAVTLSPQVLSDRNLMFLPARQLVRLMPLQRHLPPSPSTLNSLPSPPSCKLQSQPSSTSPREPETAGPEPWGIISPLCVTTRMTTPLGHGFA